MMLQIILNRGAMISTIILQQESLGFESTLLLGPFRVELAPFYPHSPKDCMCWFGKLAILNWP